MPAPFIAALAGPLIQGIGGAVAYSQQQKELGRQQDEARRIAQQQEAAAQRARASLQDYSVGRGARQAYMMSQQDRAGDIAQQEIQRSTGQALGAMSQAGAKALIGGGGASALASQAARQAERAAAESEARRLAGAQTYAGQEQAVLDANIAAQRELGLFDYGRALEMGQRERDLGRALAGEQNINRMAFTQDLFSVGAGLAGSLGGLPTGEKGMKLRETPGEFSHKTNPIDLIRNGKKIGEATGGELIFNPEQSGKLETMAEEGDTELHKYLRGLFKKFNKKS